VAGNPAAIPPEPQAVTKVELLLELGDAHQQIADRDKRIELFERQVDDVERDFRYVDSRIDKLVEVLSDYKVAGLPQVRRLRAAMRELRESIDGRREMYAPSTD
jgi:hypothetical protein